MRVQWQSIMDSCRHVKRLLQRGHTFSIATNTMSQAICLGEQNNSTSEKMIKCFVTFTPNPRGEKMVHELAGLLTDSRPDAFPTERSVAMQMVSGRWLELHSSGTVRDLHPIPFYCLFVNAKRQTNSALKIGNNFSFLQTFLLFFAWFVLQCFVF